MLYRIYEIPALWVVGLFATLFVGVCWLGIVLLGPWARERSNPQAHLNESLGDFLQYFGVMYGLLLGLLAVATYQNHTDVEKAVSSEASSLAALSRCHEVPRTAANGVENSAPQIYPLRH
jgi:hypothetical protein